MPPRPGSRAGSRVPRVPSDEQLQKTGSAMRRIRSSRVNLDWLQGPGPTDLWIWHNVDGEAVDLIELTFFGRCVLLKGADLSTGRCEQGTGSPYAQETGLLELDGVHDTTTLRLAELVLDALPPDLLSPAIETLRHQVRRMREELAGAPGGPGPGGQTGPPE